MGNLLVGKPSQVNDSPSPVAIGCQELLSKEGRGINDYLGKTVQASERKKPTLNTKTLYSEKLPFKK